jgi:hypothetical protein
MERLSVTDGTQAYACILRIARSANTYATLSRAKMDEFAACTVTIGAAAGNTAFETPREKSWILQEGS